jgi:uncharacterized protein
MRRLALDVAPEEYAIVRLPAGSPAPRIEPPRPAFVSVTTTPDEVSVVCPASLAPEGERAQAGWRLLTVRGPLEFTLTGIMAALAGELAAAGVALFAVSTFDTDHILVQNADLARAVAALRAAGHDVPDLPE